MRLPLPLFLTFAICLSARSAEPTSQIVIQSPKDGGSVTTQFQVTVSTSEDSIPLVAIRSKEKNSSWWIQERAKSTQAGEYRLNARFGNDTTVDGTQFEVVALKANPQLADKFEAGTALKAIPDSFQRSRSIEVILDRTLTEKKSARLETSALSIASGDKVQRLQEITAMIQVDAGSSPVLLVRSSDRGSHWWIQDSMKRSVDGSYTGLARFGNEKTPIGSSFRFVFIDPGSEQAAKTMQAGERIENIEKYRHSESISVVTTR